MQSKENLFTAHWCDWLAELVVPLHCGDLSFFFSHIVLWPNYPALFTSGSTQPTWHRLFIYSQLCRVDGLRLAVILIYFGRRHEKGLTSALNPRHPVKCLCCTEMEGRGWKHKEGKKTRQRKTIGGICRTNSTKCDEITSPCTHTGKYLVFTRDCLS